MAFLEKPNTELELPNTEWEKARGTKHRIPVTKHETPKKQRYQTRESEEEQKLLCAAASHRFRPFSVDSPHKEDI